MKILFICEFFPTTKLGDFTGGVEARTFFIARELAKRHRVTIVCSFTPGSQREEKFSGFNIIRVGPRRAYTADVDPLRLLYLLAAVRHGLMINADLVEGSNFICHLIAYWIGKVKGIPVIAWMPDVWQGKWMPKFGSIFGLVGELIERYNLSHRNISYIAISQTVMRKLLKAAVPRTLISMIPCGVDYRWIQKIKVKKAKKPTICCISRLVRYKNLHIVIQALPMVLAKIPNAQIKIIGQGPEEKNLKSLAKTLQIEKHVYFLGHKPKYEDVIKLIKSSQVFAFPSNTEGFGMVTIEAMAGGVPFVIADTAVNREITKGRGGFFFATNNPGDFAQKIVSLFTSKRDPRLKKAGQTIAKRYNWTFIAKQTERLYLKVFRSNK